MVRAGGPSTLVNGRAAVSRVLLLPLSSPAPRACCSQGAAQRARRRRSSRRRLGQLDAVTQSPGCVHMG